MSGRDFPYTQARHMVVADDEYASVSEGRTRIFIGLILFICAAILVIIRLAEISLFSPKVRTPFLTQKNVQYRADMTDRHGAVLATTIPTYALYVAPREIWSVDEAVSAVLQVLPDEREEDLRAIMTRKSGYHLIRRGLVPLERQALFELGLPGLKFQSERKRVYPRGMLASHIVGFVDPDMVGLAGAEMAFQDELARDNSPQKALSIDMRVQQAVSDELAKGLEKFKADTNAGVVLNMKTGEILALASLPQYDPNIANKYPENALYNHATMSTYDLGSVFKPLTMAMALEEGVTTLHEAFPVQNAMRVGHKLIRDDHPSKTPMAMPEILAQSSNRGTAMMALRIGKDTQKSYLKKLGLMNRVPIELAESARPIVQTTWPDITTVTVSYGHGFSVTPLALAAAIGAVLNDGIYVTPTLVKRDSVNPPQTRRVFSSQTSSDVRDLMRYVVTNGTGRNAAVKGYRVMGKTGTADKPSNGTYDTTRLVTSFVAAFPYEDPTYVVLVTYDEPKAIKGTYGYATAGWNAAPTVGHIIERIAPILGVRRQVDPIALSPFSTPDALP